MAEKEKSRSCERLWNCDGMGALCYCTFSRKWLCGLANTVPFFES